MRIFVIKSIIFLFLNFLILSLFLWMSTIADKRFVFKNGETGSNLFLMKDSTYYDFILLGSSHSKEFSRRGNHLMVEKILKKNFLNLSFGGGAGILPEKIYLAHFFKQNNKAGQVIYFIDPFIFFSQKWNEQNDFSNAEPFDLGFFQELLKSKMSVKAVFYYLRSKIEPNWFLKTPQLNYSDPGFLLSIDNDAVQKRIQNLYQDGLDMKNFERYFQALDDLVNVANRNNAEVIFILPPTLLGDLPGEEQLVHSLEVYSKNNMARFYDFSNLIVDPKFYYDHDHLNPKGIEYFSRRYLKPIIYGDKF